MNLWRTLVEPPALERNSAISFDEWANYFKFGGSAYQLFGQTISGGNREEIDHGFVGLVGGAFKSDPTVFACELARLSVFSEARLQYQQMRSGRPGNLFGTADLAIVEEPWPGGTTGDLLARMLLHHDFAGNAFVVRRPRGLRLLRPDWVTIVIGSPNDKAVNIDDPDAEVVGYVYHPGGQLSGREPMPLLVENVAHFASIPDPVAKFRGMSWLRPVINEIIGDRAATEHKLSFFENGATPNMVVKLDVADPEKYKIWQELFEEKYEGKLNAYKTLFLGAGADVKVVGADFQQIDFKTTQGKHETRIAAASGVPAAIVGISEGLEGSALNAGNYGQARRQFADRTIRPLWRNVAGSLAKLIVVQPGARLWYDDRDIPFLQEDVADAARIVGANAIAMRQLVDAGFEASTVVDAIISGDLSRLQHTGLFSVQLQPPGTLQPTPATPPSQAAKMIADLFDR